MKRLLPALAILCLSVFTSFGQNVGVGNTSPNSKLDVSGDLALREGTAISVTAGANTITLPSAKNSVYRLTGASGAFSITSISGGNDGMILSLINATGQIMTVTNGTIQTNTGANLVGTTSVSSVNLIYNATLGKWVVVSDEGMSSTPGWNLTGNAGTTSSNFVGTTDNNPLYFKTNGSVVGYLPSSSNNSGNTGFGVGNGTPGGSYNVFMGFHTMAASNTGNANVSFGWNVLDVNTTGHDNIGMGFQPLAYNTTGASNVALGSSVLEFNKTGSNNIGIGPSSLQNDTTGGNNVAVGDNALNALYNGSNNTVLGYGAGSTATGSNNVFLGYNAGANELTSNKLYISNSNTASPLVYGDFTNNHLTVNDSLSAKYLQLTNGATSGYLLQSDASGNGTWVAPSSITANNIYNSDGTLTGNRTMTMGADNLTLSATTGDLIFNPSSTGYVGIGTATPAYILDVAGQSRFTGNGGGSASAMILQGSVDPAVGFDVSSEGTDQKWWEFLAVGTSFFGATTNDANTAHTTWLLVNRGTGYNVSSVNFPTGNVGIGTTTPGSTLTVNGTTSTTNFQMTNGGTSGYILQSDASGNGTWVSPSSIAATNVYNSDGTLTGSRTVTMGSSNLTLNTAGGNLVFSPSGTHGYVGIGTTSPICLLASTPTNILGSDNHGIVAASLAWAVNDGGYTAAFYNGDNAYSADGLAVQIAGTSSNNRILDLSTSPTQGTAGTTVMAVLGTGNVGVGTGSPQQMLSIYTGMNIDQAGGNTGTVSSNALTFGNGSGEGMASNRNAGVNQFGLDFYTDYTNRLAITNSGNVGIGTTSPASTLTVNGTTSTSNFQMTNGGTSGYILQSDASGNGTWVNPSTSLTNIYNSDGTLTGNRTVNIGANTLVFTNGTVGITSAHLGLGTTSPYGNFDYEGTNSAFHLYDFSGSPTVLSAELHANSSLGALLRFTGPASGYMDIGQDSTGSFIIAQGSTGFTRFALNQYTGYVGIGTTTPSSTLQVNGKTTTTNLEMTNGANTGYIMQSDASGNASWVSPSSVTTATTNTLTNATNTITSTVNGVAATAPAVNTVSNAISGNTVSTTVNGIAGTAVTVPNIYTTDGTLTGNRTMTMGTDNLTLSATSGSLTFNSTTNNGNVAMGVNNIATGTGGAAAIGSNDTATGTSSFAAGANNKASGLYAIALGTNNKATSTNSIAVGANQNVSGAGGFAAGATHTVSGTNAAAFGQQNTASGYASFAAGELALASGQNAFSSGHNTTASASNSTAFGEDADASGDAALALGESVHAYSYGEVVVGQYNTSYSPASTTAYAATDRVFDIGNGQSGSNSDALTVLKNGNVGIGYNSPSYKLQVNGTASITNLEMTNGANAGYIMQSDASGNASWVSPSSVTTGTTNTLTNTTNTITSTVNGVAATAPAVNTVSNAISGNTVSTTVNGIAGTAVTVPNVYTADGTLAGNRTVTQGADNMTFSSTTGNFVYNTTSTGGNVSMGYNNTVSGGNAVAIGSGSTANAAYATAFGFGNTASGQFSTAMGSNSTASGKGSFTNGYGLTAASYNETALGTSNTSYTPTSATAWSATDRLFGVGNGSSPASPSDAFVILKNGNTGVGTASPSSTLQVNGKTTTTNFEMTNGATNGYILKSDASGNASWVNPTSITTATTNTLSLSSNTLTSTVNGVAATSNAVSGVSNTSSGNALSTTVNGVAGSGVNIINSNTSAWTQSGGLVNTINGVAATTTPASGTITNILGYNSSGAPVYQAISGLAESVSNTVSGNTISTTVDATTGTAVTVPNIYTANGTLTGARTVTMGADNLTFSSTTGNLIFSPSSTGYIGVNTASPQSLLANTATNIIGADGNGVNTPSLTWAMNTNGYTGAFYNASTATNAMGLAVKIAGTASTNKLLDLSTGSSQATAGTSVMVVLGNGNTGISNASPAYTFDVTGNLRSTAASYLASGGGDVGIGTTAPAVKLHVIASSNTDGILIQNTAGGSGAQANLYFETYSGETIAGAAVSAIDDGAYSAHLTFSTRVPGSGGNSLSERMRLSSAGYLGIGTTTPGAPLDVEAVNNTYNEGSYRWFANSGSGTNTASCPSCNVSIYTPNRIEAAEFDATSDRRIKKDITPLPAATALERAGLLNVVTFRYIDQLSKGKKNKSGFIAQEVESVLPNAVNQDEGFIPNVFDVPAHAEMRGATLVVTTTKDHDFAEGDQIRIYDNANGARDVTVARVISPDQFEIAQWEGGSDSLFVYGKKVYDYRNVDYDQITAVAIGAIQELNKKMQALEQKSNESEARNQKLQKELTDIKTAKASAAELEQLKAEVETLKQILGAKAEK